jgi:hypothetical protein
MRCIKHVKADEIFVDDNNKELFFYAYRSGKLRNYTYRHTYPWRIWKEDLLRVPITWDEIKAHQLEIKFYGFGRLAFIKV